MEVSLTVIPCMYHVTYYFTSFNSVCCFQTPFCNSKTKLNIDKIAFSVAAPTIWNQFPVTIKSSETIHTFRKQLKTHLFEIAFPP